MSDPKITGSGGPKSTIAEADLYAMGMESPTAWHKMEELCALLGVAYPPKSQPKTESTESTK